MLAAMARIETSIDIRATPATVWRILADLSGHSQWNPFIASIEGPLKRGERLSVRIAPPGRKGMAFRPRVLVVDEPHELRWIGRLLLPGIFDGEHQFRIEPIGDGVRFHHCERFGGLMPAVMPSSSFEPIRRGFEAMNQALKARAEMGIADVAGPAGTRRG
jgi:hypothetical protein